MNSFETADRIFVLTPGGSSAASSIAEVMFGLIGEVTEVEEGFFLFRLSTPSNNGGEDVLYYDSENNIFGHAAFGKKVLVSPNYSWVNLGTPASPADATARLDILEDAVQFTAGLDSLLKADKRHDGLMEQLGPHIQHVIQSAYEVPGANIIQIQKLQGQLPLSLKVQLPVRV